MARLWHVIKKQECTLKVQRMLPILAITAQNRLVDHTLDEEDGAEDSSEWWGDAVDLQMKSMVLLGWQEICDQVLFNAFQMAYYLVDP